MFTSSDPWQDFVDAAWAKTQELTGFTQESQCPAYAPARKAGSLTCAQAFTDLKEGVSGWRATWWMWVAINLWDQIDADLQDTLCDNLAKTSPVHAARVYFRVADLSDSQDGVLEKAIDDNLPKMKRQRIEKKVPRAKPDRPIRPDRPDREGRP